MIRIEFAPGLMTRELAAYYLSMSLRDLDQLRNRGDIIPSGNSKRVKYTKAELDRYIDSLPERES